jgi:UDP-N-acetylmuramoyl-L-alanyl-D-glutamate--2,6-diaminopimelate ligase
MSYISKKLNEILDNISFHLVFQECTDNINDVKTDSRTVTNGNMFIAIKGEKFDGHKFISEAIQNGAKYIVLNEDMVNDICATTYTGITIICVEDTRISLPYIIDNLYSHPTRNFKLIGVTGTNGKTSVTTITKYVLMNMNYKVGLVGTINNYIDNEILDIKTTTPTTPDCIELGKIMNGFSTNKVDITLMEVSSMALKTHRVDGYYFDIAVFTNISPEHLDNHKTMKDYLNSKLMLFDKAKHAVVNVDDEHSEDVIERCHGKIIRYGIKKSNKCDIYAKDIEYKDSVVSYKVVYGGKEYITSSTTPSEFAVYNNLAVMGICILLGLDLESNIKLLSDNIKIEGRYDVTKKSGHCSVIVDFAHTPVALENLLLSVRKNSSYKRIITVFGCGGDRDKTKRNVMGRISQSLSDISLITSDNPRTENPMNIINDIIYGIKTELNNYSVIPDRKEAIEYAIELANEDDVVVIAGKGHEKQQIFNGYSIEFDDMGIACTAIQKRQFSLSGMNRCI